MTPVGTCPRTGCLGQLRPLDGYAGWTRCPACQRSYDHHGNAYDVQFRLANGRGAS